MQHADSNHSSVDSFYIIQSFKHFACWVKISVDILECSSYFSNLLEVSGLIFLEKYHQFVVC